MELNNSYLGKLYLITTDSITGRKLVNPKLTFSFDGLIPLREKVCMLTIKLIDCCLWLMQVYAAN